MTYAPTSKPPRMRSGASSARVADSSAKSLGSRVAAKVFERPAPSTEREATAAEMSPSGDLDAGQAQVHDDSRANRLAELFRTRAVTIGNHIYFAAGQWRPDSESGRALIRHELTHVGHPHGFAYRYDDLDFQTFAVKWAFDSDLVDAIRYGVLRPCDLSRLSYESVSSLRDDLRVLISVIPTPQIEVHENLDRSIRMIENWLSGGWESCATNYDDPDADAYDSTEVSEEVAGVSTPPSTVEAETLLRMPKRARKEMLAGFAEADLDVVDEQLLTHAALNGASESTVETAQMVERARPKPQGSLALARSKTSLSSADELILNIPPAATAWARVRQTNTAGELEKSIKKLESALSKVSAKVKFNAKELARRVHVVEELRQIGTTPAQWFAQVRPQTFLGKTIKANNGATLEGVHPELGDPLLDAERMVESRVGTGARNLVKNVFGMRAPGGEDQPSMHTYALAIDIDPASNPRVRRGPEEEALRHARLARGSSGDEIELIRTHSRSERMEALMAEHAAASDSLHFYFGLLDQLDDPAPHDALMAIAERLGASDLEHLKSMIEADMNAFGGSDRLAADIRGGVKGINNLHTELVGAMEHFGLFWGARLTEPDIHHFDSRKLSSFAGRRPTR